jgi:hypothetical protein
MFPADCLLVRTSTGDNNCYIQTKAFDGDEKLRLRKAAPLPKEVFRFTGEGDRKGPELQAHALRQLSENCRFVVSAPRKTTIKFYGAWLKPAGVAAPDPKAVAAAAAGAEHKSGPSPHPAPPPARQEKIDVDNYCPRNGLLLMTDWAIGVVVYIGGDTRLGQIGPAGVRERELRRLDKIEKEKEKAKQKLEEAKRKAKAEAIPYDVRIRRFEQETKMRWSNVFTDVPDDGNCMMTAFWLGLATLIKYYPHLKLKDEQPLPKTAELFRSEVFGKLKSDKCKPHPRL